MLRRARLLGGAILLSLPVWIAASSVGVSPAFADATVSCSSNPCTAWTAPAGVTTITVNATGASGGDGGACGTSQAGGTGAGGQIFVGVSVAVVPGTTYYFAVGARGGDGGCSARGAGGAGGSATGGSGGQGGNGGGGGGGGGGDTTMRAGSQTGTVLLSAAGGGGGGGGATTAGSPGGSGGTEVGSNGHDGPTSGDGGGGGGGSGSNGSGSGGAGGDPASGGNDGVGFGGAGFFTHSGGGSITISYVAPLATGAATSVTATSATVTGTDPNADAYHFDYGADTSYGSMTPTATATTTTSAVSATITGLTPNTTYHYRIDATSGVGGDETFTTLQLPVTGTAAPVTTTGATLNGSDPNPPESYEFDYGTTTSYGSATPAATLTTGTLSAVVTGLTPGTVYHYRIDSAAGDGADQTFTTAQPLTTGAATSIGAGSATLQGTDPNIGSQYGQYWFDYGPTTSYGGTTPKATATSSAVSAVASGLLPGTTYHYRIDSDAGAGSDQTFTTLVLDSSLTLAGPKRARLNSKVKYHLTVANIASATITLPLVQIRFAGKHQKVKLLYRRGCTGSKELLCKLPAIAAGQHRDIVIVLRPLHAGKLHVVAKIATIGSRSDPTPQNNQRALVTTVATARHHPKHHTKHKSAHH